MMSPTQNGSGGVAASSGLDEEEGGETRGFGGPTVVYVSSSSLSRNTITKSGSGGTTKRKHYYSGYELDNQNRDSISDDDETGDGWDSPKRGKEESKIESEKKKRAMKNAREKERSSRIAKQIEELRDLLTKSGVVVPKGTKGAVLSEVATYIRFLLRQSVQSELDKHALAQQLELIGGRTHGSSAGTDAAILHTAALQTQSLGGVQLPKPPPELNAHGGPSVAEDTMNKVDLENYKLIIDSLGVGMAIASLAGFFLDCNNLFTLLSNYSKEDLCALTIFNLMARCDLQRSFELISRMVMPPDDQAEVASKPIVIRGAVNDRQDLGLSISLVKDEKGLAKFFCVTLVKNPATPFDTSQATPVSYEAILVEPKEPLVFGSNQGPAYACG